MANLADTANRALRNAQSAAARVPLWGWAGIGVGVALLWALVAGGPAADDALPPAGSEKGPMPTIKLGSEGSAVSVWQKFLGIAVTGKFDQTTKDATIAWQKAHPAAGAADGIVGPKGWTAAGWPTPAGGGSGSGGGGGQSGPDFTGTTVVPDSGGFQLSNDIATREQQIEGAILDGAYDHAWEPLVISCKGHSGTFFVSRMPLALAVGDARLIVSTSFTTAQHIADMLPDGAYMLTSKLADEIQRQADVKIDGQSREWQGPGTDNTGSTTKRMVQFSDQLYDLVGSQSGLVSTLSKVWAITKKNWTNPATTEGTLSSRHNGANHGLYSYTGGQPVTKAPGPGATPGGLAAVQSLGLAHNRKHVDYSQLLIFVRREATVDGQTMDVADVARDPELSCLVSDEGTLPNMIHPDLDSGANA